jgi:hypothetical protein
MDQHTSEPENVHFHVRIHQWNIQEGYLQSARTCSDGSTQMVERWWEYDVSADMQIEWLFDSRPQKVKSRLKKTESWSYRFGEIMPDSSERDRIQIFRIQSRDKPDDTSIIQFILLELGFDQ